jgi:hypothetical protein
LAQALLAQDFQKAKIPEFLLFGSEANRCSVFQKRLAKDEPIELGKWGILVAEGVMPESK